MNLQEQNDLLRLALSGDKVFFNDGCENDYAVFVYQSNNPAYKSDLVYINYYNGDQKKPYTRIVYHKESISKELVDRLRSITRIEKNFDGEYFPIWTSEDGEILTDNHNFVKLNGVYYSSRTLENLLKEIRTAKDAVLKLHI